MTSDFKLIRSNRKTLAIEIKSDGNVFIRAPLKMKRSVIDAFVKEKTPWIEKHLMQKKQQENAPVLPFTDSELQLFKRRTSELAEPKVRHFAEVLGVTFGKVNVRRQRTLWGSCTKDGNLSFNCLLCLVPEDVLDYVIIHELCHRINMDHSKEFWSNVQRLCPDYKECRSWLKANGGELIKRIK